MAVGTLLDYVHKLDLKLASAMSRCRSCGVSVGALSAYSRGGFGQILLFPFYRER